MPSEIGDLLVSWTIRLSIACYVLRLAIDLTGSDAPSIRRAALAFWTAGYVLFIAHVICVFHYIHGWSHAAAYEHTERRTAETVGFAFGPGLYVNYLFIAVWTFDLLSWWRRGATAREGRWHYRAVQAFFAFILFNATVVFGPRLWIPAALFAAGFLFLARKLGSRQELLRGGE